MKFFIKDYSSKYDQIRIFLCSDQCTEKYHVLDVRNVGSTGNDCTKWMNTIKIHKPNMMVVFLITFVIIKNGTEIQNFSLSQIYNSTS